MFVNIETFLFDSLVNAQAMQLLDAVEQGETAYSSPEVDDQDTEALSTEESPASSIESAVRCRQQTRHQRTKNTTHTVYRRSTNRIVNVQFMVDKLNGEDEHDTADKANNYCSYWRYEVTACRNTNQSCQHAVQRQRKRGFAILGPGEEHRCHHLQLQRGWWSGTHAK